jgi:hypothetical protein
VVYLWSTLTVHVHRVPLPTHRRGPVEHLQRCRKRLSADPEVDTYEKVEGNYVWRAANADIQHALRQLKELSATSPNEFVLMHTPSGKVIPEPIPSRPIDPAFRTNRLLKACGDRRPHSGKAVPVQLVVQYHLGEWRKVGCTPWTSTWAESFRTSALEQSGMSL